MKLFDIWVEGYRATGDGGGAIFMGAVPGHTFNDAVEGFVEDHPEDRHYWKFSNGQWSFWGCRAFDNEIDARKSFG